MIERGVRLYVAMFIAVACLSFAIALPTLQPQTFSVNDSVSAFYNITINNSEIGSSNITQVNITLPSGFIFTTLSNGSSVSGSDFSQNSNVLNWNKTDFLVQNISNQSFWFNASANTTTIGTFNFSISILNSSGVSNYNLSVTVNDTKAPTAAFASPTPSNHTNTTSTSLTINVSAIDNHQIASVNITVYNRTGLFNSVFVTSSPFSNTFTSLVEGNYTFNATVLDNSSNVNYTQTRRLIVDTTDPTVSAISLSSNTETSIVVAFNCTDAGSGVKTCVVSGASGSGEDIDGNTISDLECGESYTITVTATDHAGNDDTEDDSFSTDSCSSSSSSTSTSSGAGADSSNSSAWTSSYSVSDDEFKSGYTKELAAKHRLRFKVGNEQHSVGVVSLTGTKATINVSSKPQQAVFSKGDSKKFDVDEDNFYDILVTLNSIDNSKANITIVALAEEVADKDKITATTSTSKKKATNVTTTTQNSSSQDSPSKFSLTNKTTYTLGAAAIFVGALVILYVLGREKKWFDKVSFLRNVKRKF